MKKILIISILTLLPPREAQAITKQDAIIISAMVFSAAGSAKLAQKQENDQVIGFFMCVVALCVVINSDTLARI